MIKLKRITLLTSAVLAIFISLGFTSIANAGHHHGWRHHHGWHHGWGHHRGWGWHRAGWYGGCRWVPAHRNYWGHWIPAHRRC